MQHTISRVTPVGAGYVGKISVKAPGFAVSIANRIIYETKVFPTRDAAIRAVNAYLSRPENCNIINQWGE